MIPASLPVPMVQAPAWVALNDEALLKSRICDFKLQIDGTELEREVSTLYAELDNRGIVFHPPCYLGDEWFCPDEVPVIALPFYLAHPRLKQIEQKMMHEVEGGDRASCMRLLRHEAGHALNYAYLLHRRKKWRELFGDFSQEYPETYHPHPYSKRFVRHLDAWYAQYHPDEDFAETFAVWLTPDSDWRKTYEGWKAIEKLEYVDQLMREIAYMPAKVTGGKKISEAGKLRSTLTNYYRRKQRMYAPEFPEFYDRDLRRIFSGHALGKMTESASAFLRRHRTSILISVSKWSAESKFIVNRFMQLFMKRCRELDLKADPSDTSRVIEVASYLTTLSLHHRWTGKFVRIP